MAEVFYVVAGKATKKGRVALLEEDPRHPLDPITNTHRVFIKHNSPPTAVAMTELVAEKIRRHELKTVSAPESVSQDAAEKKPKGRRTAKAESKTATETALADAEVDGDNEDAGEGESE